jgi:hypothetical protein
MRPEVWGEIIRPSLSDRKGWACFIGTPRGQNLFYDLYTMGQKGGEWCTLMFRADETGVIPPDELASAKAMMSDNQFRQEFLCDFSASVDNVLITIDMVSAAAAKVYMDVDVKGAPKVMGVDVARYGDDRSAICMRQGLRCISVQPVNHLDNMTLAGIVGEKINLFRPDGVFIDAGRGEGVIDRLRQLGFKVMEINFGSRALDPHKYANRRTEMWDKMREWLVSGGGIPNDSDLKSELSSPMYTFDAPGRMVLESKEKMKERLGRSPDLADSLALTFAAPVLSATERMADSSGGSWAEIPIAGRW